MRLIRAGLIVAVVAWGDVQFADAAPPPHNLNHGGQSGYSLPRYQPQRPTVSPYVALAGGRTGVLGAATYYTFVRPEIQQQAINNSQSIAIERLQNRQRQMTAELKGSQTGHQTGYLTQDRYFNTVKMK